MGTETTNGGAGGADAEQAIEARLDALREESLARRDELRAIAAALPEATSRRAMVTEMFRSMAAAPNKADVTKRGLRKLARAPRGAIRRLRAR